eukprot:2721064-Pyramimonas_sp.AAC.1
MWLAGQLFVLLRFRLRRSVQLVGNEFCRHVMLFARVYSCCHITIGAQFPQSFSCCRSPAAGVPECPGFT